MKKYTSEQLKRFSPDELNEMVEAHEISWSEWIEAQSETYNDYHEWLESKGLERNDESAVQFIREVEDSMMDEEKPIDVEKAIETFHKYRKTKA